MTSNTRLRRSDPESQGISSKAVLAFIEAVDKEVHETHSLMLLRRGQVIAEGWWAPYRAELPHMLFSLTKSFTSTAVGLAVSEGRLTVNEPVISFFPDDCPAEISDNLAAMRVHHLLSMVTGHDKDSTNGAIEGGGDNWVKGFLSLPVENPPGAPFVYNSGASNMLSAIVQKVTGLTLKDYLRPRLFEPLGIENLIWETDPRGINIGGWGLTITTEDIACFGQMLLQKGMWNGQQVVPAAWIDEATSHRVSNGNATPEDGDWAQGYGYQFWRCRHNAFRGDGAFGQFCIVMPDQEAVLAVTAGMDDMQRLMTLAWDLLLPEMTEANTDPLPPAEADCVALQQKLASLKLVPTQGKASSPMAARVSGRRYLVEPNEEGLKALTFDFSGPLPTFTRDDPFGVNTFTCGVGVWHEESMQVGGRTAYGFTSGVWTNDDTFQVMFRPIDTPFLMTNTCRFVGDTMHIESRRNVSFGPLKSEWTAKAESAS